MNTDEAWTGWRSRESGGVEMRWGPFYAAVWSERVEPNEFTKDEFTVFWEVTAKGNLLVADGSIQGRAHIELGTSLAFQAMVMLWPTMNETKSDDR